MGVCRRRRIYSEITVTHHWLTAELCNDVGVNRTTVSCALLVIMCADKYDCGDVQAWIIASRKSIFTKALWFWDTIWIFLNFLPCFYREGGEDGKIVLVWLGLRKVYLGKEETFSRNLNLFWAMWKKWWILSTQFFFLRTSSKRIIPKEGINLFKENLLGPSLKPDCLQRFAYCIFLLD